ncbi:hypothetical protein BX592_108159 [Paraburkholderia rhizosphaerae]|uniref:Uncharacterized protein n=1 Tax=Paraburkholderia rhizosphaerae TaxID=480658 RepID=A0A4R8LUW4_9BURK|nr:hypothetical protein BX592_108159 [Paraburkholderia rhizosphaerae]
MGKGRRIGRLTSSPAKAFVHDGRSAANGLNRLAAGKNAASSRQIN